jgi:DNA-binding NtrC family response regulator
VGTIYLVGTDQPRRSLDVLVVDDEPDVANSTAAILASIGFEVATAATVADARAVMADCDVRSVVLDHSIVEWDTESCSAELEEPGPVIVVVSGLGREELDNLVAQHGDRVYAALAKPVPPARLIEVVRGAVGS